MNLRFKSIFFPSLIILLISISPLLVGEVVGSGEDDDFITLEVRILDAWYEDRDNDGKEDDVIVIIKLESSLSYATIYYDVYLELPSGLSFTYSVWVTTYDNKIIIKNIFWNHATESGWYFTSLLAYIIPYKSTITGDELIFDPPGGDESDPTQFSVEIV